MEYILTTQNLCKNFKKQIALKNINIHLPVNKIYCLLGPNGAGKTTLMKIFSGMIHSTSGKVYFDGHEWSRKDLAYIGSLIENAPIYGNLTARENMKIVTTLRNEDDSKIDNILESVGLSSSSNKMTKDFSLGMKERLGIGMALVGDPKLLILDEPTNGLDPLGIQDLRILIKNLKKRDITILISSHMLSEVEHLADYVGFIVNGELRLEQKYNAKDDLEKLFNSTLFAKK